MPIHTGHINGKYFWEWGKHGKKYVFNPKTPSDSMKAKKKAIKQGLAVYYSQKRAGKKVKLEL